MTKAIYFAAALCLSGTVASADCLRALSVQFTESAPRDRFDIVHTATGVVVTSVRIDLSTSAGGLIFDTEDGGAGVEVFQPFQGSDGVRAGQVSDGADVLEMSVDGMTSGERAGFTIDVDDRLERSDLGQIRVTGGEMQGARVLFQLDDGEEIEAVFDAANRAKVCS